MSPPEPDSKLLGIMAYHNGLMYEIMKDGNVGTFGLNFIPNRPSRSLRELAEANGLYDFRINWRSLTWSARSFQFEDRARDVTRNYL